MLLTPRKPLKIRQFIHAKVLWAVIEHYRIFMASRTLVREKLRAKHRERQENEVAKRTVVMCARLRRSLPLCEAGQLNIAALVGRWIDGHCQRHRQLGRQLRVLCQDRPRRRADDPVCPLFRHLRYGWSAGADWTGDCLCGTYREGDGKSSAF